MRKFDFKHVWFLVHERAGTQGLREPCVVVMWSNKAAQVVPFGVVSMHWAPHVFRAVNLHTLITEDGNLSRLYIVEEDGSEVDVLDLEVRTLTCADPRIPAPPHLRISAPPHC